MTRSGRSSQDLFGIVNQGRLLAGVRTYAAWLIDRRSEGLNVCEMGQFLLHQNIWDYVSFGFKSTLQIFANNKSNNISAFFSQGNSWWAWQAEELAAWPLQAVSASKGKRQLQQHDPTYCMAQLHFTNCYYKSCTMHTWSWMHDKWENDAKACWTKMHSNATSAR